MDENMQNQQPEQSGPPAQSGPPETPSEQTPKKSSSTGMWIGLLVIIGLGVAAYFIFFN